MKSGDEILKTGVELKELARQFLNKTKLLIGDASIHTLLKIGNSNETVLEIAKEIKADIIFIIMAAQNCKGVQNRVVGRVTNNDLINSKVRILTITTNKECVANL